MCFGGGGSSQKTVKEQVGPNPDKRFAPMYDERNQPAASGASSGAIATPSMGGSYLEAGEIDKPVTMLSATRAA